MQKALKKEKFCLRRYDEMGNVYIKYITREGSLFDIKAWYEGESKEFERWTGFGFYNTIFVSKNGIVTVYYNKEECDKFENILDEKLNEDFFNNLCDDFFGLIEEAGNIKSDEDVYNISVKCWPALTIFDEISKYPEWATDDILRRLIRVRKTTESFHYELSKRATHSELPKDYIFFRGELIQKPFKIFTEENNITIIESKNI